MNITNFYKYASLPLHVKPAQVNIKLLTDIRYLTDTFCLYLKRRHAKYIRYINHSNYRQMTLPVFLQN